MSIKGLRGPPGKALGGPPGKGVGGPPTSGLSGPAAGLRWNPSADVDAEEGPNAGDEGSPGPDPLPAPGVTGGSEIWSGFGAGGGVRPNGLGRAPVSALPFNFVLIFGNPIDALLFALDPEADMGVLGVELDGEGLPLSPPVALGNTEVEVDIDIVGVGAGNSEDCVGGGNKADWLEGGNEDPCVEGGNEGADVELGNDVEPAGNKLEGAKLAACGFSRCPCD